MHLIIPWCFSPEKHPRADSARRALTNPAPQQLHGKYRINHLKKNHLIFKKLMMRQKPTTRALRANCCLLCITKSNLTKPLQQEGGELRRVLGLPEPRHGWVCRSLTTARFARAPPWPGLPPAPLFAPISQLLTLVFKYWNKRSARRKAQPWL